MEDEKVKEHKAILSFDLSPFCVFTKISPPPSRSLPLTISINKRERRARDIAVLARQGCEMENRWEIKRGSNCPWYPREKCSPVRGRAYLSCERASHFICSQRTLASFVVISPSKKKKKEEKEKKTEHRNELSDADGRLLYKAGRSRTRTRAKRNWKCKIRRADWVSRVRAWHGDAIAIVMKRIPVIGRKGECSGAGIGRFESASK